MTFFKSTALAIVALATVATTNAQASTADFAEVAPAAPMIDLFGNDTATDLGLEVAGGYGHRRYKHRGHGHWGHGHYKPAYHGGCFYKKRKVWSNYYHGWVWKKVKVCY